MTEDHSNVGEIAQVIEHPSTGFEELMPGVQLNVSDSSTNMNKNKTTHTLLHFSIDFFV